MLAPLLIPAMMPSSLPTGSPFKGNFIVDLDDIVDQRSIEIAGHKASSDTLNAMFARLTTTDDWRMLRLDGNSFEVWVAGLM